ncbi:hypothetical protein [Deferrisoma palaeochoriense]
MDLRQIRALRAKIMGAASTFESDADVSPSRRVPGLWTGGREEHGYRALRVYVEKGLGAEAQRVAAIVEEVDDAVEAAGYREFERYLFSFGWPEGTLRVGPHPLPYHGGIFLPQWRERIQALAGTEPCQRPVVLPSLWRANRGWGSPSQEDLIVFVCRDRQILRPARWARRYTGMRLQIVWIFLDGDGGKAEFEFGRRYLPSVEPEPGA